MPDPKPTTDTTAVVPGQSTTDVITGSSAERTSSATSLSSIFDKVEAGQNVKDAIKETMTAEPEKKVEPATTEKKEEKQVEATKTDDALDKKLTENEEKKEEVKEEEFSRESLRKQTEAKKEEKKEEAKKEDKKTEATTPDPDAPSDDELQVLPQDKPKTAKRIAALLKKVDAANAIVTETKKEADAKAAKLKELEAELAKVKTVDPTTDEKVKTQLEELSQLRRRYQLDKDPEVKSKFDDRIDSSAKSIIETLIKNGAGEGLVKLINDEGGWVKFAQSNRTIPLADGTKVPAYEFADTIMGQLPTMDKRMVEAAIMEQIQLKRDKDRFFEEQQKNANEYFKKKEEESSKGTEEQAKRLKEGSEFIAKWHKENLEKHEWLKEQPVPANATPEQKAQIEDDNKYTKQLVGLLNKSLNTKDLNGMLDIVFDSVQFYQQRRENVRLTQKLAKAESDLAAKQVEIDKFKTASRSTPRSGSLTGGTAAASTGGGEKKPQTLEDALNRIAAGGNNDE